jgi:pimeloyl-ACP methyl ester carboxylesterase
MRPDFIESTRLRGPSPARVWTMSLCFLCPTAWAARQAVGAQAAPSVVAQTDTSLSNEVMWLKANGLRLKTSIYRSAKLSEHPVLVVVLHGDLLGVRAIPKSTYHYLFAREAAAKMDNVIVAALLRPGYRDSTGQQSEGDHGDATGDNYTPEVVDEIAQVTEQLKQKFHPAHTMLAGHSGGAAITGDILGRRPGTADAALMVSCPCDLAAWRHHMQQIQNGNPIWSKPVRGLSPMDLADKIAQSVRVRLIVGADDPVAPAAMTERYADRLRSLGDDVSVTVLPGLEHEILLEPATFGALTTLVEGLDSHK